MPIPPSVKLVCPYCYGAKINTSANAFDLQGRPQIPQKCPYCDGTGEIELSLKTGSNSLEDQIKY